MQSGKFEHIPNFKQFTAHALEALRRFSGNRSVIDVRSNLLEADRNTLVAVKVRSSFQHSRNFAVRLIIELKTRPVLKETLWVIARADDGKALVIQKSDNSANDQHLMVLVITTVTASSIGRTA